MKAELSDEMTSEQLAEQVINTVQQEAIDVSNAGMQIIITSLFEQYAARAVAKERERCAVLMETLRDVIANDPLPLESPATEAEGCLAQDWVTSAFNRAAIRIREEPK